MSDACLYTTPERDSAFLARLGARPLFVFDMDGCSVLSYSLRDGKVLPLRIGDDSRKQSIPFGASPAQIRGWVANGTLAETIFAKKTMDVRHAPSMVSMLNSFSAAKEPFKIAFLTSRSMPDAMKILQESGVHAPDRVSLIGESGAVLRIKGQEERLYTMTEPAARHLTGLDGMLDTLNDDVAEALGAFGLRPGISEGLRLETKEFARNFHYRHILEAYHQHEGGPVDLAIAAGLKARLASHAFAGPNEEDGMHVFTVLDGPATVEFKVCAINKGVGLERLAERAAQADMPPTGFAFFGDDVAKKQFRGTDYFAMAKAPELERRFGVPFLNGHVHHPVGEAMDGTVPDPAKTPAGLAGHHPVPRVDLRKSTPAALISFVETAARSLGWYTAPESSPKKPEPRRFTGPANNGPAPL